jgi:Na+/proline symporter
MQGLHPVDITVIVLYLVGITALGIWMARRVKHVSDFFMPRRFGKGMMIMHAFGTGTASDQAVTVASATFRGGLSGIWYQWLWLFVTPFYWLIAPIFRRFRAITTADVYELRFDQSVAVLFALVGIANMCVKIGLMLKGASVLIESGTGGMIDTDVAIIALTIMFVTYGVAGGLAAAIVTDYVQGLLTILFSFMLLPFIFSAVDGMSGIRESVADPAMLSLVAPGKVTAFFIIMMSIQALVGIVAQPFIMGVCAAGKTEWEGRVGIVVGNIIKRLCTAAWTLTAIAAVAWYTQQGIDLSTIDPDFVYGNVAQAFLPQMMPGLLGVFLAALLGRRNVLFIAVDDLRTSLGCYGDTLVKSPNIDRLARQSRRFTRAYCHQAVCGPSRTSILTGRLPDNTRVWHNRNLFRDTLPDLVTLPEYFKNHGYHAQSLGKVFSGRDREAELDPQSWSVPPL